MAQYSTVINTGNTTYKENYKGDMIEIPPGKSIKMPRRDAVGFMGSYRPLPPDQLKGVEGSIIDDRVKAVPKPLKLVHEGGVAEKQFISPKDGLEFESQEELDKHLKQFKPLDEETTTQKVYVCPHCEKEVKSKAGLIAHMRSHDDTKPDLL